MEPDTQLEWFDFPGQPLARREVLAMGSCHIRHDHAVLVGILALIGVSIVYALGVDRGKELAASELSRPNLRADVTTGAASSKSSPATPTTSSSQHPSGSQQPSQSRPSIPLTAPRPKLATTKTPSTSSVTAKTSARPRSTFAIQIVSYSQPVLAQQELQRLHQRGEQVFVLSAGGHTVLLLGPFQTRDRASAKLASLKPRYQGCFIRTL